MDLIGAITSFARKENAKLAKETDSKKKKQIRKNVTTLLKLSERVLLKIEHDRFINNEYTTYTAKDFKGKKIMSDKEYNKLMVEWSEKVGEQLLSANEEYVREHIERFKRLHPDATEQECSYREEYYRNISKDLKEQEDARKELQHEREIWWEQYRKMTPEEKEHYYEELCGPTIGSAKRVYKNTITLKTNNKGE